MREHGVVLTNLLRRKTRTLLTLIGIAIGVAAVVALGGMAEGFINTYTALLTASGADIILAQSDAVDLTRSAIEETVGPQVAAMSGVKEVSGVLMGVVVTLDVPYFVVVGLDPKEFGMRHYKLVAGRPLAAPREMLLGRAAARNFNKKVGDYFKIQDVSCHIVGLYETGQNVEDMGGVIAQRDAQAIFRKPGQVTYYQIKLQSPEQTPSIIAALERRFPKLAASRSANFMDNRQQTQQLRATSWFIGLLAIVAGGLVMTNTLLMSVFERTREIGVLRALGWRKRRVLGMILSEALALSIVGAMLGILAGLGMIQVIAQQPTALGILTNSVSPALVLQAMLIALVLGAIGGLYPAWRASQLEPVEAMRYDGSSQKFQGKSDKSDYQLPITNYQLPSSLRNILRQRTHTLLTALTIGVGVGLVVALGGLADGLLDQFNHLGSQLGDLVITQARVSDTSFAAVDDKVRRYAATLDGVESISGFLMGGVSTPGAPYFFVFGLDPTGYAMRHFAITAGDRLHSPHDMIMGKIAARNFKKYVGDSMHVSGTTFRVVGIFETGIGYEESGGVVWLQTAQQIMSKPNQVNFYGVKLADASQADKVRRQIEAQFPAVVVSQSSEFGQRTNDFQSMRALIDGLSLISILVGGVGMLNAMLMSVFERTREIGVLRALGWRRRRVVWMIVREALMLSLVSGVMGILVGIGLGKLITLEPSVGAYLTGIYTPALLAQALAIALVLGVIGSLYPAWRASNLSPIEALRYE